MNTRWIFGIAVIVVLGCHMEKHEWKLEPLDKKHVSYDGSYDNGIKNLKLISHEWKIYEGCDTSCEWAFRVKISFPQNKEYDSSGIGNPWKNDFVMSVNNIEYRLYDADDFVIDSLILQSDKNWVAYKDTAIFQMKGKIQKGIAGKVKYGRIQLMLGYAPPK